MESIQDPFALFEQGIDIDLHSVFKQEAYNLLVQTEDTRTNSDELFAKVDNLLNVASEMLEYEAYVDIVSLALRCSGHDHMLEQRLRESRHGDHAEHVHEDDEKTKDKKQSKRPLFRGGLFFKVIQPPPQKKSLFEILLGVK